jgi:hypothetical protein
MKQYILYILIFLLPLSSICCKKNNDGDKESSQTNHQNISAFTLDYENPDQLQVHKSELFLRAVMIKRYHTGQDQPTRYNADDISKIILHNIMHPDTKEWSLMKMDIVLKDGSLKTEHPLKVWNVDFSVGLGRGSRPVPIEQHFIRK